jgi:glycyl-radical enzyme activating protein
MSEKAIVFDIQRASLHDGPGIRTTIFLKGCPLDCLWCHNPEATSSKRQLFFHYDKCTQCGDCTKVCPENVHQILDNVHIIDYGKCNFCGKCVEACNYSALKIIGNEMSVDEVMKEVIKDMDFYENSGGGITLSGGEPLFRFSFSKDILTHCKELNIHTCVETSGFVSPHKFQQILPLVDVLLFDYKLTGSDAYKKYTGVSNQAILENLNAAYQFGISIILRCIVIPGINDTYEHFEAIAALEKKYPKLKAIEILPYHDMGNNKRTSIGREETLTSLKTVKPEISQNWIIKLRELGCEKVKMG